MQNKKIILVTGGSGLVGHGVKYALSCGEERFRKHDDETWIFVNSKDADLRFKSFSITR
jgi:GDP-L-fucose synthase